MTDIVERLRHKIPLTIAEVREAADEIEKLRVERDAQYDENVKRIAAEGAAILRAEAAEAEIERLRQGRALIDRGIFLAPSGYWWAWSNVKADRASSLRTKDKAKAQAMYDRMLKGQNIPTD